MRAQRPLIGRDGRWLVDVRHGLFSCLCLFSLRVSSHIAAVIQFTWFFSGLFCLVSFRCYLLGLSIAFWLPYAPFCLLSVRLRVYSRAFFSLSTKRPDPLSHTHVLILKAYIRLRSIIIRRSISHAEIRESQLFTFVFAEFWPLSHLSKGALLDAPTYIHHDDHSSSAVNTTNPSYSTSWSSI